MTTLFVQNQIEGCPNYVESDPYQVVVDIAGTTTTKYKISVDGSSNYGNTEVDLVSSAENESFAKFLVNRVFNIYGTANSTNPTNFDGYESDTVTTPSTAYLTTASIDLGTGTATATHLAGSLFTFKVNVDADSENEIPAAHFDCALLLDETFDNNGTTISKVDVTLKKKESLMQTLYSTSGNVYNFKKAVKITDFMSNLEQMRPKNDNNEDVAGYKKGFLQFNMIEPTNMSESTASDDADSVSKPTIPSSTLYSYGATQPTEAAVTNFTGYFVICAFGESTSGSEDLTKKFPYLTILRIVHSKTVHTKFNEIFQDASNTNNCILDHAGSNGSNSKVVINTEDVGISPPFQWMIPPNGVVGNSNTIKPTLYVLKSMCGD